MTDENSCSVNAFILRDFRIRVVDLILPDLLCPIKRKLG